MADYRDDPRWKEYGFGRDMFPGGGTTPVASSEYMTADAGDALRRAWGWIKEKGRSETTGPEAMGLGIPDYTPEKGELYKYLDSSREDAERKALEERDRLLRETEEYDKTFKKISGEYDEYGKTERSGDITKEAEVRRAWEDWADYGSPTDGDSDTIVVDPTTGVDILYDSATPILDIIGSGTSGSKMSLETPLEAIPEVDTFKELSSTPKTSRVLYSPFAGDVPPPEPFKTEGFTEYFDRIRPGRRDKIAESGTKYIFGKEEVGSYPGAGWNVYESPGFGGEEGRSIPYETYDSYGRPFVMGMDGRWQHKELAPLLWDSAERQHNASMKAQTDKRNAQIAAYWEKVDEHTKFVEDYIKSSGITAEEYSKRSTAATPLKSEYVKEHPDYEELVREAVPTLDERLDVPDDSIFKGDREAAIKEALAPVKLEIGKDSKSDLEDKISTAALEVTRILEDMGLVPTGEGVLDKLGTVIKDAKGGVLSPSLGLGAKRGHAPGLAFDDAIKHALGASVVGEGIMDLRESLDTTGSGSDPMDYDMHEAVGGYLPGTGLSPEEAVRAATGEAVRRIVDPSAPYASARSPEVLETKFEDAFGSSVLDSERLPISFTRGMSAEDERAAYLSRGSDIPIDPTFAPDASMHYTDPLKHYDTETVPGHSPLSLTTPFTTAVEGWEHAAEFAPPEWSYPAMPPPSDYSYPGFIPSSPFGTAPYSPPGYSPVTGTFYPTAAEIIAAGGGELFTEPSPLMIP